MDFAFFEHINNDLINNNVICPINTYFCDILKSYKNPVDVKMYMFFISFANTPYDIVIDAEFLHKFYITSKWTNIEKRINKAGLTEGIDYQCDIILGMKKKEIKLNLYGFKLCLMRSKSKYKKQYIILEEIYKHYKDYIMRVKYQNELTAMI